jgi:tetratricopeptide (TPR) repeat protein
LIARAIEIEDGYGDRPGTAATLLTNLGSVYFSEHKDALATKAAEDSLERLNKLGDSGARAARNLGLLGAIDLWYGQSAQAESYLQRALDISQSVYIRCRRYSCRRSSVQSCDLLFAVRPDGEGGGFICESEKGLCNLGWGQRFRSAVPFSVFQPGAQGRP